METKPDLEIAKSFSVVLLMASMLELGHELQQYGHALLSHAGGRPPKMSLAGAHTLLLLIRLSEREGHVFPPSMIALVEQLVSRADLRISTELGRGVA
jgi:hypothetical protein